MILVNKPQKKAQESGSPVFQELKAVCLVLGMSKPPANITMFQFFSGIEKKVSRSKIGFHFQHSGIDWGEGSSLHFDLLFFFLVKGGYEQSPAQSYRRSFDEEAPWTSTLGKFTETVRKYGPK